VSENHVDVWMVVAPIVICFLTGAIHGSLPRARMPWIVLAAFLLSGLLCWSVVVGGVGHPPGAVVLPAWLVSPIALLSGDRNSAAFPSPWLHPWLAFAVYLVAARLARPTPALKNDAVAQTPAGMAPEADDDR
jgi:hypothetical protein